MSTDIDDKDKPTAVWFRMARASQTVDDGAGGQRPWTVPELIERMQAEVKWAPGRTNYSTYEQGHTVPKPSTMATFYRFWKRYGIDPPDLTPKPAPPMPPDPSAALIEALKAQTDAITKLADQVKALVERPADDALPGLIAAAVALAVHDTLRDAGVEVKPPRK